MTVTEVRGKDMAYFRALPEEERKKWRTGGLVSRCPEKICKKLLTNAAFYDIIHLNR